MTAFRSLRAGRAARLLLFTIAAMLVATMIANGAMASGQENDDGERYAIGLWGDLPYSDTQALTGIPNLIADINTQDLAFTVHDGDLKANGTPRSVTPTICSDALYTQALGFFNALKAPAHPHTRRQRLDRLRSSVEWGLQFARAT